MNDADARMRRRGTTLLVTYILLGEILGMSIGGWEAVRPARSHFVDDSVYAARPDDDAADDADERDPMVVLPLLGLRADPPGRAPVARTTHPWIARDTAPPRQRSAVEGAAARYARR